MNPLICDCHVEWIWNELHHKSRDWDSDILANNNKNFPLQCIDLKTKQGHDLSDLEEGFCGKFKCLNELLRKTKSIANCSCV